MDELTDSDIMKTIERLRLWLFADDQVAVDLGDQVDAGPVDDASRQPTEAQDISSPTPATVNDRDAPAVWHDRGG